MPKMIIKFNKKFYSLNSINQSIKDFSDFGTFELKKEKNQIMINILLKKEISIFKEEFCNYVLSLNQKGVHI